MIDIINKLGDSEGSNVDYFEITTTADISAKYMVQAENVSLAGSASTSKVETAIGKYHVGGIAQNQLGSMTFQVYSHKDQTVEFGINFGEYKQFLFDDAFDLKVNGEVIASDATILDSSTSAWTEWTEYDIANIELEAGWNTIVVDKNNKGAHGTNIDYFYFNNVTDLVYFSY